MHSDARDHVASIIQTVAPNSSCLVRVQCCMAVHVPAYLYLHTISQLGMAASQASMPHNAGELGACLQVGQICLRGSHCSRQLPQNQWPQGTRLCAATTVSWHAAQHISSTRSCPKRPCALHSSLTLSCEAACRETELRGSGQCIGDILTAVVRAWSGRGVASAQSTAQDLLCCCRMCSLSDRCGAGRQLVLCLCLCGLAFAHYLDALIIQGLQHL